MKSAYLVIAHGSREKSGNEAFSVFMDRLRKVCPDRMIHGAYLDLAKPAVPEAIETCLRGGAKQIFLIPLMFFPGKHVKEDIPRMIQEAREEHPDIDFHYAGALAEDPGVLQLLKEKIQA